MLISECQGLIVHLRGICEIQDKLQFLAGQSSGYIDTLPKMVKRRVKALQELQVD